MRLAEKPDGWSRTAIGRRLGETVVGGNDMMSAVGGGNSRGDAPFFADVYAVTATSHHLHVPGCSRPMAVVLPGFRYPISPCHRCPCGVCLPQSG